MMEIEKKFAKADLSSLATYHEDRKLKDLATHIVKFQLYKAKIAAKKMPGNLEISTKMQYFSHGVRYIREGFKSDKMNLKFYKAIDDILATKLQPLTPSEEEKSCLYNRDKKVVATPSISIPKQITQRFEYAIRNGNQIMVFDDEDQIKKFINNLNSLMIAHNCKPVSVVVEDLK